MKRSVLLILFILPIWIVPAQEVSFTKVTSGSFVNDGGWNYAMSWADFNNDGLPDLFVTNNDANSGKLNFLYMNNGDGTFAKVTEGPVVSDGGSSYSCTASDIDGDGNTDLFVANYNENNFLYFGNGDGTFIKETQGPVVTNGGKSVGAAWTDYDMDGYADLYVANRDQPNFLYHGTGPGTFEKITTGGIATESANSSGCSWGDYDNDGYPDLYVANSGSPCRLYHNNADGTFSAVEEAPFTTDVSYCSGASWGDCDNDGDLDLFVATGQLGMYNNWFYLNDGDGTFTKVTEGPLVEDATWSSGSAWGDYDKDGDLDLAVGGYDGDNLLFRNEGDNAFIQVTGNSFVNDGGYTEGLAWADADDDGDLDIFTAKNNYFGGNNSFFLNDGNGNNWLKVNPEISLAGMAGSGAYGARVWVHAMIGGLPVMQVRELCFQTGGGQGGQNERTQFFGLGDANVIDSVVVEWAGERVAAYNVMPNQTLLMEMVVTGSQEFTECPRKDNAFYPNPTTGQLRARHGVLPEAGLLRIFDSSGNPADVPPLPFQFPDEGWLIDLRDYARAPGVYFIQVVGNENIIVDRIVLY